MTTATFEYEAVDRAGVQRRGMTTAQSEQDAYRKVAAQGLTPVKMRARKGTKEERRRGRTGRVSQRDVTQFTHQLGVLLQAGIPLSEGLRGIAEQETHPALSAMVLDIARNIEAGSSVSDALEAYRRVFGDVFVETIRAAERSGTMVKSLAYLSEHMESTIEARQQVRQALTYPVVVIIAMTAAIIFLLTFVVPRFATMFAERGVELPFLTRALQLIGESIRAFWWIYLAGVAALFFSLVTTWRRPAGRLLIDRFLHKIPYLRGILTNAAIGRFATVFGMSLDAGLGLIESLHISGAATGRPMLIKDSKRMQEQVRLGGRLSESLQRCSYFPGFAKRMITAGEESAELGKMCKIISRHYDREVSHAIKNLATVLEPVLIAALTGVVLIIALAVFMPMWSMIELV